MKHGQASNENSTERVSGCRIDTGRRKFLKLPLATGTAGALFYAGYWQRGNTEGVPRDVRAAQRSNNATAGLEAVQWLETGLTTDFPAMGGNG
jgi:hypothetical protein